MRTFSAREHEWQRELDGIELAGFWPRAGAFVIDWLLICVLLSLVAALGALVYFTLLHHPMPAATAIHPHAEVHFNIESVGERQGDEPEWLHLLTSVLVPVLYFGILLWKGKGRTPGKRLMRIRVVSIVHPHLTFWHYVERARGYGAAALELGFGFLQFFIHPYRRCAQDRLAETIVVTERAFQTLHDKFEA